MGPTSAHKKWCALKKISHFTSARICGNIPLGLPVQLSRKILESDVNQLASKYIKAENEKGYDQYRRQFGLIYLPKEGSICTDCVYTPD